jgi:hypothetical protein
LVFRLAPGIEHQYALGMVLAALAGAVEELELSVDGPTLLAAIALRDRLDAKIAAAAGEFDHHSLWDLDAATSLTAWLRDRASMTANAAGRLAARGRRLRVLPVTTAAAANGSLSGGQLDVVLASLDDRTASLFADHEAELVPALMALDVRRVGRAMAAWKARATADDDTERGEPVRAVRLSATLDGRRVLDGTLDAEGGAVVEAALREATTADGESEERRIPATRRADALVDICRFFLDHRQGASGARHRPHVNVVIDEEELHTGSGATVVDGPKLDSATASRLLCDCQLHRLVRSGRSEVLDYGRSTRTIPVALWNALVLRDQHCRFPGCDRPAHWTEGHHVRWFSEGGPTAIANLVLLCSRHHHRLHLRGWKAKLSPDAAFEVTDPVGRVRVTRPPGADPPLPLAV